MALVSIIIPTYNRVHLIGETLESIIAQSYKSWECLIVDDWSTDDTATLIADYIKKDARFQYHQRPVDRKKGANACRNYGFELSKGKYIKWFDSDDIMHPDFLEKQVQVLEKNKYLDFCICLANEFFDNLDSRNIFKANRTPKNDKLTSYLVKNHYFFTASPLWKKSLLRGKPLFDEDLTDSQETDFHFRMLSFDVKYEYTNDVLFSIRRGHSSITQDELNLVSSNFSRFKFFLKAFEIVEENEVDDKNLLKQYILYRLLGLFYFLNDTQNKKVMTKYYFRILKNIIKTKYSLKDKIAICIGFLLIIVSNKGHNLIKRAKVNIIEVIEN
ncbi:hypothetical protein DOS84_15175 [Flavobacterium aquariorum]|uniref:Glycosyltransferase 2-like domain-containing protein n=1 Tax=Flavobacterium aquariorum TaxID=2217670 RepID=A0A2W7TQC4_9FLAO|nr:glycosyltransferase family 2 protein [Flavobacterium aquariorum]PZX92461.1 hypothetical protein DOS84_15175 [Flavobacterium aquariorum]